MPINTRISPVLSFEHFSLTFTIHDSMQTMLVFHKSLYGNPCIKSTRCCFQPLFHPISSHMALHIFWVLCHNWHFLLPQPTKQSSRGGASQIYSDRLRRQYIFLPSICGFYHPRTIDVSLAAWTNKEPKQDWFNVSLVMQSELWNCPVSSKIVRLHLCYRW